MSQKQIIYIAAAIGSTIGSFLSTIWRGDLFSISSIILSVVGGLFGIYIGYKIAF